MAREDIVMFINACLTCTGQREFYDDACRQTESIAFLHRYILGNYRRLYAQTLAAGINHFNQSEIILSLLASVRQCPPESPCRRTLHHGPGSEAGEPHRRGDPARQWRDRVSQELPVVGSTDPARLAQMTAHQWNMEWTAQALGTSVDDLILRIEKAGFGGLIHQGRRDLARKNRRLEEKGKRLN